MNKNYIVIIFAFLITAQQINAGPVLSALFAIPNNIAIRALAVNYDDEEEGDPEDYEAITFYIANKKSEQNNNTENNKNITEQNNREIDDSDYEGDDDDNDATSSDNKNTEEKSSKVSVIQEKNLTILYMNNHA